MPSMLSILASPGSSTSASTTKVIEDGSSGVGQIRLDGKELNDDDGLIFMMLFSKSAG